MIGLLLRAAPARLWAAPALALLQVAAIALGVGAVVSVQLLNRAALDTLDATLDAVSGAADLVVSGVIDEPGSVPDAAWPAVLATPGVRSAAPVIRLPEVTVSAAGSEIPTEVSVAAWGVDILSNSFAAAAPVLAGGRSRFADLGEGLFLGGIVLPPAAAAQLGASVGDPVRIERGEAGWEAPVVGVLAPEGAGTAAFLDLAFAQALRGRAGFDRIEVAAAEGADPAALSRTLSRLLPGVRVESPDLLREQGSELFSAFRLNLLALSAVSVLVGAFLVHASVRAALAARRREIALYRALGASARQTGALLLGEVLLATLAGVLLGIPVGGFAALASLDRVSATITNFYLLERIDSVALTPGVAALAALAAVAAALPGSLPEVLAWSRRPPAALLAPGREFSGEFSGKLSRRAPRLLRRFAPALFGAGLMAAAGWPLFAPGSPLANYGGGFGAAAALLTGAALLSGAGFPLLAPIARAAGKRSSFSRGAAAAIREPRSTGPPTAALVVAAAMLLAVTALIGSFRATLDSWLGETLVADVYVSRSRGPGRVAAERRALPSAVQDAAAADPEVAFRDLLRALRIRIEGRPTTVLGVESSLPRAGERFSILGDRERALRGFRAGAILVSEPLARRLDLRPGDRLPLPGVDSGERGGYEAEVAGVYRDYGNEIGALFMDRRLMNRLYPPPDLLSPEVHGMALYLREGAEPGAVIARLERSMGSGVFLVDNRTLRARALRVFDQTMAVTGLLRAFALLIAAFGLGLALWTLVRERAPEIALYRALGASRAQVVAGFLGRGAAIVAMSLAIGGGAGVLLTLLLVRVVNPAWFGWTLELHWPIAELIAVAAAVLLAGLVAAALPARLASRVGAAPLREEV